MYILAELRDEDFTELSLKKVIIYLSRFISYVAIDQIILPHMIVIHFVILDLPQAWEVDGSLQNWVGVDGFATMNAP